MASKDDRAEWTEVPILEAPGRTAVGRFGWAAQHARLLSFSADTYRNAMGVTSPLHPDDNTQAACQPRPQPTKCLDRAL